MQTVALQAGQVAVLLVALNQLALQLRPHTALVVMAMVAVQMTV